MSWFERWGRFASRHKWFVVGGWFIGLALLIASTSAFGGTFATEFELPGSESQQARDLLRDRFPERGGDSATIVFFAEHGVADEAVRGRIESILDEASRFDGVVMISSPFEDADSVSGDGRTAFAAVRYAEEAPDGAAKALTQLVDRSGGDGLTVEVGGNVIEQTEQEGPGASEIVGITAAAVILLVAFGSLVAMGVPIIAALFSLGAAIALLGIMARFLSLTDFTPQFAAMIGLGVGIDYCLLVLTRYREGLHAGEDVEDAVAVAMNTAGRSVLFAGTVVVIAMLGLTLMGIPFVAGLGIAGATVVVTSVVSALTLLPAILAIAGRKVDALSIPFLQSQETGHMESIWFRLSLAIQRRPWLFIAGATGILLTFAIPVLSIETNFTDAGNNSRETHSRRAYDLLKDGFGPGFNGPLVIAVDLTGATDGDAASLVDLRSAIAATEGVASVAEPRLNPQGDTAVLVTYPATSPQDSETNALIHRLRAETIPDATSENGLRAYITGPTAASIDVSNQINGRLPLFFAMVIGLSFIVLMLVFRSLVVPLTAALMNLLSIGAAYGIVVAVFQWGWFASPLGIQQTGPIEAFLPMMMFAMLFGLSMDYEVFLVSRIHEEYVKGASNSHAVAMGLSTTARVITSAALIMIAVFGSFMLGDERVIKEFGLGLSVAILLDATVVRLMLLPAIMELLGDWNWWLPGPLDRILPRIDIEGSLTLAADAEA